jgi:membrane protein implicated in regulation of membrane protease activity
MIEHVASAIRMSARLRARIVLSMLLAASIVGLFVLPGPWNVILFCVALVFEAGEIVLWMRFLERYRVQGGVEGMIGERATVIERCDPGGLVRVRGEVWKARMEGSDHLLEGERGAVVSVDGLTVTIRPERR